MTFLYPAFLFLSGFILVPIIIYFLKKPKVKRIKLPTLRFLKKAASSKRKKISIKELIILLLRVIFILLLVLSISNLVLKDRLTVNDHKTIIIVDNTLSFLNSYTLKQYKEMIYKKVAKLKDEYSIEYIRYVYISDKEVVLRKDLSEMKESYVSLDIKSITEKAKTFFLDEEINIITFSDCQDLSGTKNEKDLNIIDISKKWKNNIVVESVNRQSLYFQNKPSKISFLLRNNSNQNQNIKAKLFLNDELSAFSEVLIERNSLKEIRFDITPKNIGFNKVVLEISGDEFSYDNIYYSGIFADYRFLIGYSGKKINKYIELAFSKNLEDSPFIFEELSQINIDNTNAVIIADALDKKQLSALNKAMEKAVPLFIFAPENSNAIEVLNTQGLIPFKFVDMIKGNFRLIGEPILEDFLFWKKYMIDKVRKSDVKFRFDDGSPAILEYKLGRSDTLFFNMFLTRDETNFVLSPYFVLYWFNTFTKERNRISRFINRDCDFIYNRPGIYKDQDNNIIFVNISKRESDFSTYSKNNENINLSSSEMIKGDLNLNRILAFLALLVFLMENLLIRRWT